jgi:Tfp pilus assembly protein PilN
LIAAGALVAGLTLVNLATLVRLSGHNTELSAGINRDRGEAERLTREAATIRRGIDQKELQFVVNAAREANQLIDRRTFSWTAFFNHLEATMPPDVMLRSVRPVIDEGVTRVTMVVLARRYQDADDFQKNLEDTGLFDQVVVRQQVEGEDGLQQVTIDSVYRPDARASGTPAPPEQKPEVPR